MSQDKPKGRLSAFAEEGGIISILREMDPTGGNLPLPTRDFNGLTPEELREALDTMNVGSLNENLQDEMIKRAEAGSLRSQMESATAWPFPPDIQDTLKRSDQLLAEANKMVEKFFLIARL